MQVYPTENIEKRGEKDLHSPCQSLPFRLLSPLFIALTNTLLLHSKQIIPLTQTLRSVEKTPWSDRRGQKHRWTRGTLTVTGLLYIIRWIRDEEPLLLQRTQHPHPLTTCSPCNIPFAKAKLSPSDLLAFEPQKLRDGHVKAKRWETACRIYWNPPTSITFYFPRCLFGNSSFKSSFNSRISTFFPLISASENYPKEQQAGYPYLCFHVRFVNLLRCNNH